MNCSKLSYACIEDAFNRTKPEAKFGVDRILYKDWYIHAFQGVSYLLDKEGIYCCSGSYPEDVNVVFETKFNVACVCNFSCS